MRKSGRCCQESVTVPPMFHGQTSHLLQNRGHWTLNLLPLPLSFRTFASPAIALTYKMERLASQHCKRTMDEGSCLLTSKYLRNELLFTPTLEQEAPKL
jgi:hypothetical protein